MKIALLIIIGLILGYFIATTIVDIYLMGILHFSFSRKCKQKEFLITRENRIDYQEGNQCAGFSSAFVMRHWGEEADGRKLYDEIPYKMKGGYVYPKEIPALLKKHGFKVKYRSGNVNALKNDVSKGSPVIIMIRMQVDRNWLHYVTVLGYDEDYIYIAESWDGLVNVEGQCYNRKVAIKEFKRLWNTRMLKMPLYQNTYFVIEK